MSRLIYCSFGLLGLLGFAFAGSVYAQTAGKPQNISENSAKDAGRVVVGKNTMVSAVQPGLEHSEYIVDADPTNPMRMMVCVMRFSQEKNRLSSGIYVTHDGGRTWALGFDDFEANRDLGVYDPACAYGANGEAYFITLKPDHNENRRNRKHEFWGSSVDQLMNVYQSSDGGRHWDKKVKLGMIDSEELLVDRTGGPYRGRMYIYGYSPLPETWIVYSSDGGRTWPISSLMRTDDAYLRMDGRATILPDSTLLLPYSESTKAESGNQSSEYISVVSTSDGGQNLSSPKRVWNGSVNCGDIAMASDHSDGPFRGRAYISWPEWEGEYRGCKVLVSFSDDKGNTWSPPLRVTSDMKRPLHETRLMPQLAVNNVGVVGLAWYEPQSSKLGQGQWLRFRASLDGGESWTSSINVSTHSFLERNYPDFAAIGQSRGGGYFPSNPSDVIRMSVQASPRAYRTWNSWPGDYTRGLTASTNGTFHAFWIDNRTGKGEMYTAPIRVRGKAEPIGSDAIRGLANVTSALELQVTSSVWNPATKSLTLKYRLKNSSQDVITGPLRIRYLGVESQVGVPKLVSIKPIEGPTQNMFDGSDLIPPNGLDPGQSTGTKSLILKYDEANNLSRERNNTVASVNVVVYGKRVQPKQ